MHLTPTAECQISILIFENKLWRGGLYKYPIKNILRTAKFLPTWDFNQKYFPGMNWLKCLGGFLHLKPTVGCQISTLIFEIYFMEGVSMNIPRKIYYRRQSSCPLGVSINGISMAFNWLKCLGASLHLKPTAGCQISTLIFYIFLWRGSLYKYPRKNILRTAKFLTTRSLRQRYYPVL